MNNNDYTTESNNEPFNATFDFNKNIIGIHFNNRLIAVLNMLSNDLEVNIALSRNVIKIYKKLLAKQNS